MKRHGGTLNAYCSVKEAGLKRLWSVCDILEKTRCTEAVKTNEWLPRISEEEGMDRQSPEILRAVKLRCETLHLPRPAGGSAPVADAGLSGALGVTEPAQQGLAAVTGVPLGRGCWGREAVRVWGQRALGNSLYASAQFCCEPKTALKSKV